MSDLIFLPDLLFVRGAFESPETAPLDDIGLESDDDAVEAVDAEVDDIVLETFLAWMGRGGGARHDRSGASSLICSS